MKQKEAVKCVENCQKASLNQPLLCLMEIKDYCKAKYKVRLWNLFELFAISDHEVGLSYCVSNIEILFKEKLKELENAK